MTKTIRNFGTPIGGGRKKRNHRILERSSVEHTEKSKNLAELYDYLDQTDKIREEKGSYKIQKNPLSEPIKQSIKGPDNRRKPLPYTKLDSVCRTGPDYLEGGRHANENDFKELGIKGVEFGSSLSDEDAQTLLDECYLALCDLVRVLGIDRKDVSLGGTLSLAFASRGNGGSGPATYDPKHHVINFTKEGGAGSLAHEWAHALDYYMGKSCGLGANGYEVPISGCLGIKGVPPSVKALLWEMSSKREKLTPEEQRRIMEENHEKEIRREEAWCREILEQTAPENMTEEQQKAWNQAVQEVYDTRYSADLDRYVLKDYPNRAIEKLSRVHKEITGRAIPKDKKRRINYHFAFLNKAEQIPADFHKVEWKEEHTKFFNDSWELHERYARTVHGRHCDNCERMARAFECYVADKLEKEGNQSQYLTSHSEDVVFIKENGEKIYWGPEGKERKEINQRFDLMFCELKEIGIIHYKGVADRKLPERRKRNNSLKGKEIF